MALSPAEGLLNVSNQSRPLASRRTEFRKDVELDLIVSNQSRPLASRRLTALIWTARYFEVSNQSRPLASRRIFRHGNLQGEIQ